MITSIQGDLLDVEQGIIAHQVNCQGVMGAGLAKALRNVYPDIYVSYKKHCGAGHGTALMGKVQIVEVGEKLYVANLFSQEGYGKGVQTDYEKLEMALGKLEMYARRADAKVYLPYLLGCGLAGGDWNVVADIIHRVFDTSSVDCVIVEKV